LKKRSQTKRSQTKKKSTENSYRHLTEKKKSFSVPSSKCVFKTEFLKKEKKKFEPPSRASYEEVKLTKEK